MERQFIYGNRNVPSTIVVMMYGERELGACRKKVIIKRGKKTIFFVIVCCSIMLMMMSISFEQSFFLREHHELTLSSSTLLLFVRLLVLAECTMFLPWMCHHVINVEKHVNKKRVTVKFFSLVFLGE